LYLIEFVAFLQNAIDTALNPFITSSFGTHGLLNVGSVMATALGGCIPLVIAKVIDVFGRVEGFFVMLLIVVAGMAMKAACTNVQTYIAGHVLYWAGHIGVLFVADIMAADCTTLRNRMIIFTLYGTPRIASTFAGPAIADLFYYQNSWRWAFGAFIVIFVGLCAPALVLMIFMYRKAKKAGLVKKVESGRNVFQSLWYYCVQFDSKLKTPPIFHFTVTNSFTSLWHRPHHVRMVSLRPAFQSRSLRTAGLENPLHHRLHRPWAFPFPLLLHLGSQVRARPIPTLEIPQGRHHCWLLLAIWRHVSVCVLLERILLFLLDRRTQAKHSPCWIHSQRLLTYLVDIQPSYRIVDSSLR
jgi:hypothetical protein